MTVMEIGIFKKSVLILYKSFYPLTHADKSMNYRKRSNLINQIQQMAEIVLKGKMKILDNEKYRIHFSVPDSYRDLFIYAIDDKHSSASIIQEMLSSILHKFQEFYPDLSNHTKLEEVQKYEKFTDVIDNTLSDERFTPMDRIKRFLL